MAGELLKSIFIPQAGDYIVSIDEHSIVLIKELSDKAGKEEIEEVAHTIVDMLNTEAMLNVRVAYGIPVNELKDVSKSYKEAKMALEVGSIFYDYKRVISYEMLGIGRLIYQLPQNLCRIFIKEIYGDKKLKIDNYVPKLDQVIGTWNGKKLSGVGGIITWIQDPAHFTG